MVEKTKSPIGRRELVAVFDESGGESNVPGGAIGADFSLAAVIFAGRPHLRDLIALDSKLQAITGRADYKYRQVRQLTEARQAVVDALQRQSGLIRLFGYCAAGGAFLEQAKRELHAVRTMGGDLKNVSHAQDVLERMQNDPRREGLSDAIQTSIPAVSAWSETRNERIKVYFDDRTDLSAIAHDLLGAMEVWNAMPIWGSSFR